MSKYNISISESSYRKIQKKLQQYEIKIGGMNIRNFIIAHSFVDDMKNPPELRIKRIIMHVAGDFDNDPEGMTNDTKLESDLKYGFNEYALLRKRLDHLVKEYDRMGKVGAQEAHHCVTVADCIDLVNSKIKAKQSN